MDPYNPWHHIASRYRTFYHGPSRILWFILGGGAATWWIKYNEMQHYSGTWDLCHRPVIQNTPTSILPPSSAAGPYPYPMTDPSTNANSQLSFKSLTATINNIAPISTSWNWGWGGRREAGRWKEDQDHLADLRRQVTEAMGDMSEAALESILTTAETLKAKLTETRAQHKKQEEHLERQIQGQLKDPSRLI